MSNELLLVLSAFLIFSLTVLSFLFLGEKGLIAWTVIATIVANIEVLILIKAFGMEQTLGNIMFASTFLVTDILSEFYGKKAAKKAINIGIFTSFAFILLSQYWFSFTPVLENQEVYKSMHTIFSNTPRLMIVGLLVYAVVQRFDVFLYHKLWDFTTKIFNESRKGLWIRNNFATLVSQMLNTVLFTIGAFWGVYDVKTLWSIIVSAYIIFIFTTLLDTPFIYLARMFREKKLLNSVD